MKIVWTIYADLAWLVMFVCFLLYCHKETEASFRMLVFTALLTVLSEIMLLHQRQK